MQRGVVAQLRSFLSGTGGTFHGYGTDRLRSHAMGTEDAAALCVRFSQYSHFPPEWTQTLLLPVLIYMHALESERGVIEHFSCHVSLKKTFI